MEKLQKISKEIQEKKGKEWLGILPTSEKYLQTFKKYINHSKLKEKPNLAEKLVKIYEDSKLSNFLKMESMIRILDQLKIQLGDATYIEDRVQRRSVKTTPQKRVIVVDSTQEIDKLKKRVEKSIETSPSGNVEKSLTTFLEYLNNPELEDKLTLVEEMVNLFNSIEAADFAKMQAFDNMLIKIGIKLGSKPTLIQREGKSARREWAIKGLEKKLEKSNDDLKEINELLNKIPVQFIPALEGELYKLSLDEDDPEIILKELASLTPFLKVLSEINPAKLSSCLKSSKYFSVIDLFKLVVEKAKAKDILILNSKEKFMNFFFPQKEVEEFEELEPLKVLSDNFGDPFKIPGALEIFEIWDGIINFGMLIKTALAVHHEDPLSKSIVDEIGKILESLSYGDQTTIYNRALKNAAERKDKEEVITIISNIKTHLKKDFINKINNDILPRLGKAKLGEDVFTFQEDSIKKIGIDVTLLKWASANAKQKINGREVNIDMEFHRFKEQEMTIKFSSAMETIRDYLEKKAREESFSKELEEKRLMNLSTFFNNFEWRWERGCTLSEIPLLNAIGVPILKNVSEAETRINILINELIKISGKQKDYIIDMPISSGLKSQETRISPPVREFVKNMENIKEELAKLQTLNNVLSKLSGNMRLVHKFLPHEYIQNPEFLIESEKFFNHLIKHEREIKAQKVSSTISEQDYDEKIKALSKIKDLIQDNEDIIKEYSERLILLHE